MNYKNLALLFMVLIFFGCASGVSGPKEEKKNERAYRLQLSKSCPELEDYIKSVVLNENRYAGIYYSGTGAGGDAVSTIESAGAGAPEQGASDQKDGATEYSTTNVQEEGVDEADFVKNDGSYIYVLNKGNFHIADALPAAESTIISTTAIEGYPTYMFVHDDKALIFSRVDYNVVKERFNQTDELDDSKMVKGQFYPLSYWRPVTKVTVLGISDRSSPKLERETYLEASYIASRMINDTVHFIGYSSVHEPFFYNGCVEYTDSTIVIPVDGFGGTDIGVTVTATAKAQLPISISGVCISSDEYLKLLEEMLAEIDYKELLPKYYDIVYGADGAIQSQDIICSCENSYIPEVTNGKDVASIVSFDLKTGEFNSTAIIGQWGTVYASTDSLYFASYIFDYRVNALKGDKEKSEEYSTIHKFDISSSPDRAVYLASGKVPGQILNQFSMSEYDGFFRVATTENSDWLTGEGSKNNIFVLKQNDALLDIAGSVTGIAPTERIYSAIFIKDKGYVVTFRQVDPMFTIDLSDPFNPKVVGELKVPGFSTYLHPMGDDHILAIGRDATDEGQVKGLKLSIFDVSNFHEPELLHDIIIGENRGANSNAEYDHKAFNYFANKDLLAIPLSHYDWEDYTSEDKNFNGLLVLNVTVEDGFKELGKIDHKDLLTLDSLYRSCYYNMAVSRSIIMDDSIYSLSEWGIKANLLAELTEVSAITYPYTKQSNYCY